LSPFETVIIETRAGHYELTQAGEVLLAVPEAVFDQYEADDVFPMGWRPRSPGHPVRRLFWNPENAEFLMAGLEAHPARTVEGAGATPYRSYLQGFWLPEPPVLLFRPYWNPADPYDAFDTPARLRSFRAQWRLLQTLTGLRPPSGWTAIINATDPYLEALGVNTSGTPVDPDAVRELSLTPAAPLASPAVAQALEVLATEHVGAAFPVLREGVLAGVHALILPALHAVQALLDRVGIPHQEGPFRPH
jgi:hypothetical protein